MSGWVGGAERGRRDRTEDVTGIRTGRGMEDGSREMADEIYNIASEK